MQEVCCLLRGAEQRFIQLNSCISLSSCLFLSDIVTATLKAHNEPRSSVRVRVRVACCWFRHRWGEVMKSQ